MPRCFSGTWTSNRGAGQGHRREVSRNETFLTQGSLIVAADMNGRIVVSVSSQKSRPVPGSATPELSSTLAAWPMCAPIRQATLAGPHSRRGGVGARTKVNRSCKAISRPTFRSLPMNSTQSAGCWVKISRPSCLKADRNKLGHQQVDPTPRRYHLSTIGDR